MRVNLDIKRIDLDSIRGPVCDKDLETEDHIYSHELIGISVFDVMFSIGGTSTTYTLTTITMCCFFLDAQV